LRLSHLHLPKLQRINMTGLRLELCQQAAKSFLREKLGALDSLGTMGAFTIGRGLGVGLSAQHLLSYLHEDTNGTWEYLRMATTMPNSPPRVFRVERARDNPEWRVPFHYSANLFNMPQTGMFRMADGTIRVSKWNCTLSDTRSVPKSPPPGLPSKLNL